MEQKTRNDLNKNVEDIIETKFIEIVNDSGKDVIVGLIYRPRSGDFLTFKNTKNTILEKIDRENKICCYIASVNTKRDWLICSHVALDKCNVSRPGNK